MSTSDDCGYCFGTMGLCPVCGPFEYAPSESVGYDPESGQHQAEHVDGWDLSGRMSDWEDNANARGWCSRDTLKFFGELYGEDSGDLLHKMCVAECPTLRIFKPGA